MNNPVGQLTGGWLTTTAAVVTGRLWSEDKTSIYIQKGVDIVSM